MAILTREVVACEALFGIWRQRTDLICRVDEKRMSICYEPPEWIVLDGCHIGRGPLREIDLAALSGWRAADNHESLDGQYCNELATVVAHGICDG
jgi:hypothetical protein